MLLLFYYITLSCVFTVRFFYFFKIYFDGAVSYYYKCSARKKRLNDCQKSIIKKEKLETLVIDTTLSLLRNPTNLDAIAEAAIETYKQQQRDKSILSILTNEYNQTKKRWET